MNGSRFDTLAKLLAAAGSRQHLITQLASTPLTRANAVRGLVAGATTLVGVRVAVVPGAAKKNNTDRARKRSICHCGDTNPQQIGCVTKRLSKNKVKRHLKRHSDDYQGSCVTTSTSPSETVPPNGTVPPVGTVPPSDTVATTPNPCSGRSDGTSCGPDRGCCGGTCVNFRTDSSNCGRCGRVCTPNLCYNGVCGCDVAGFPCPGTCGCSTRSEGGAFCTDPSATCSGAPQCPDGDRDCPLGTVCTHCSISDPGFCIAGCQA